MTQEEVKTLSELYHKFAAECERVGKIICHICWDITSYYEDAEECDMWKINGDLVIGTGQDKYGDGLYCEFPLKYLTMSDDELTTMINKKNADYREEQRKKKEEEEKKKQEATRKRELAELKRLKEKYEDGK
jgi:hypothetical protein